MMTRAFRRSVCRVMIGVLLFAQFAVAAHACENLASSVPGSRGAATSAALDSDSAAAAATDAAAVEANEVGASPRDDMAGPLDPTSANICAEHCRYGHQTFDPGQLPSPSPALFAVLYVVPALAPAESAQLMPAEMRGAPSAASPPHTILHCCFRI